MDDDDRTLAPSGEEVAQLQAQPQPDPNPDADLDFDTLTEVTILFCGVRASIPDESLPRPKLNINQELSSLSRACFELIKERHGIRAEDDVADFRLSWRVEHTGGQLLVSKFQIVDDQIEPLVIGREDMTKIETVLADRDESETLVFISVRDKKKDAEARRQYADMVEAAEKKQKEQDKESDRQFQEWYTNRVAATKTATAQSQPQVEEKQDASKQR